MDFELKNLEILESTHQNQSTAQYLNLETTQGLQSNSIILNELHKENEELQNKLKLNYRRLLLFETENSKLIEEKNKLFFESQNYQEKQQIILEKNNKLEAENNHFEEKIQLLSEKVHTLEKINTTQLSEINRFSKFHLKIQNVVKPYIVQLKKQVSELKTELNKSIIEVQSLKNEKQALEKKENYLTEKVENITKLFQQDKNCLIASYEEQIHSFSKEILNLQSKNEEAIKEVSRLKKAVEFKNYYENELIKFKRIHEEDQFKYQGLLEKKTALEATTMKQEFEIAEFKNLSAQLKAKLEDCENTLEVTRQQLSKQIDESVINNERILRLEKLNNQLSREMTHST